MKIIFRLFIVIYFISLMSCQTNIREWDITSPDKRVTFRLKHEILEEGNSRLAYSVTVKTDEGLIPVIDESPVGIRFEDQDFTDNLVFMEESGTTEIDENYQMVSGKQLAIHNHAREKTVVFTNDKGAQIAIDFRAYDEGAAFRYRFPQESQDIHKVTGELTAFHISGEGLAWIQPYDTVTKYTPAYETYYKNGIPIGTKAPGKEGWAFPALFKTDKAWVMLTESNLRDNFYGAHLQPEADQGVYKIRLPEPREALNTGNREPESTFPWTMTWRVIMTGENLSTIVESNIVSNLADPAKVEDKSWIVPGRASWSWWSDHGSPQDYNELVPFIDLAFELGWEYSLVDANWNIMRNGDLEKIINYANERDIGILVWYNSGGPHNTVGEQLRDAMHLEERRREEFEKLHGMGVKGVKVDFFQSDKPHIINLYHDILEDAADYQILCNFHGCTIPRGWQRTYPHMLTLESVKGAEAYSFAADYPEHAPWHNTILPFTRNVIGPMDYTPVTFSDQTYPHVTTYGHELALSVVFESGLIHFADRVEAYLGTPDFVRNFLSEVPAAWNQTRFLAGFPGEYCVMARQHEGLWYIGGINGQDEAEEVVLSLPFITRGNYLMEIINDGRDDRSFLFSKKPFKPGDEVIIDMKPRGGFVAVLRPV